MVQMSTILLLSMENVKLSDLEYVFSWNSTGYVLLTVFKAWKTREKRSMLHRRLKIRTLVKTDWEIIFQLIKFFSVSRSDRLLHGKPASCTINLKPNYLRTEKLRWTTFFFNKDRVTMVSAVFLPQNCFWKIQPNARLKKMKKNKNKNHTGMIQ